MSVIQSIRDRGAWIVFAVIALALIALFYKMEWEAVEVVCLVILQHWVK
jgi:hypothetical protein